MIYVGPSGLACSPTCFFVVFHREVELGGVSRSGVWYMSAPAGERVLPRVFLLCFTGRWSWAEFPEVTYVGLSR